MKNGKILSLLMTAVFLLASIAIAGMEPEPEPVTEVNMPLSATVHLDGHQEQIRCWQDGAGDYIFFLPSGADMSDVTLFPGDNMQVVLDQIPLEETLKAGLFQPDTPYELACTAQGVTTRHTLTFLQSAQLPSLYIDVLSGSMDIIHETKGNQESGSIRLYSETGEILCAEPMESLKGRGNSSWYKEKKPYSMTLNRETDLLGMGQANNWVLMANAMDPSHLRNKAVYDLAAEAGMAYTPECRWVDLYLNGEYAGLYLLTERNEIHPNRVDLPEAGSFLVSRESRWRLVSQNYAHVELKSGAALRIHDSALTETDLGDIWQSAENAILAEDGIDPVTGKSWQELIDLDSWAMDYLSGEIFGNVDCGTISTYFYRDGRDPSGKICAGPVWDYDLSMGSKGAWQLENVQAFFGDKAHIWSMEDTTWYYWLNRKPEFQARVRELYETLYRPLVQELLENGLDTYAAQLNSAVQMDRCRWGVRDALEETEHIRQYMTERLDFLDSVWIEGARYYKVLVLLDENSTSVCHGVIPGGTLPALPGYEESWDILGWYDAATETPFDITQPIEQDTIIYLKKLPTEEDRISPLQMAPIGLVLVVLAILFFTDRKCRRARKQAEKPIAKQEIV